MRTWVTIRELEILLCTSPQPCGGDSGTVISLWLLGIHESLCFFWFSLLPSPAYGPRSRLSSGRCLVSLVPSGMVGTGSCSLSVFLSCYYGYLLVSLSVIYSGSVNSCPSSPETGMPENTSLNWADGSSPSDVITPCYLEWNLFSWSLLYWPIQPLLGKAQLTVFFRSKVSAEALHTGIDRTSLSVKGHCGIFSWLIIQSLAHVRHGIWLEAQHMTAESQLWGQAQPQDEQDSWSRLPHVLSRFGGGKLKPFSKGSPPPPLTRDCISHKRIMVLALKWQSICHFPCRMSCIPFAIRSQSIKILFCRQ